MAFQSGLIYKSGCARVLHYSRPQPHYNDNGPIHGKKSSTCVGGLPVTFICTYVHLHTDLLVLYNEKFDVVEMVDVVKGLIIRSGFRKSCLECEEYDYSLDWGWRARPQLNEVVKR